MLWGETGPFGFACLSWCLLMRVRRVRWGIAGFCFLRSFLFLMRLPKSKAQIGAGRYEGLFCAGRLIGCDLKALAFPCIHGGLLALPLCGAVLTFFACRKESGFPPRILKRVPLLGGGSGASGICALAHFALVTRQSFFPPRAARSPEGAAPKPMASVPPGGGRRLRLGETPKQLLVCAAVPVNDKAGGVSALSRARKVDGSFDGAALHKKRLRFDQACQKKKRPTVR